MAGQSPQLMAATKRKTLHGIQVSRIPPLLIRSPALPYPSFKIFASFVSLDSIFDKVNLSFFLFISSLSSWLNANFSALIQHFCFISTWFLLQSTFFPVQSPFSLLLFLIFLALQLFRPLPPAFLVHFAQVVTWPWPASSRSCRAPAAAGPPANAAGCWRWQRGSWWTPFARNGSSSPCCSCKIWATSGNLPNPGARHSFWWLDGLFSAYYSICLDMWL